MGMTTQRVHLTIERIRKLAKPEGKQAAYVFDDDPRHLSVRVTPAGAKSFVFAGKLHRVPLRLTIGSVDTWTLEDARAEARRLQTLLDKGIDPREEKAQRLAAVVSKHREIKRQEVTVGDAWTAYIKARQSKWGTRSLTDHQKAAHPGGIPKKRGQGDTEPGTIAPLMSLKLADLKPAKVADWLERETLKRPTQAALAYRLLRGFLRWCAEQQDYASVTDSSAVSARIVREHIPLRKAKDGDCLQREQLAAWFRGVLALPPVPSAYLQALLLTGARRGEMAGLRWDDVDFQWQSLRIRDKVEGERVIPLTPYLSTMLLDLKRRNDTPPPVFRIPKVKQVPGKAENWQPSPWVFSSPASASGRIADPNRAHTRALIAAGLPHVTLHGLRRSFGTLAEWVECPTGVVAQIQGHKPSAIAEKHYRRRPLDLLRMWHTRIEAWMLEQAGIEQPLVESTPGVKVVTAA